MDSDIKELGKRQLGLETMLRLDWLPLAISHTPSGRLLPGSQVVTNIDV